MQIIRVNDFQTAQAFIGFPASLYKDSPHWIRPLDQEIKDMFTPEKNSFFESGEAERWILTNFRGTMIGRVAAFVDYKTASEGHPPLGGFGFFECINHSKAAFMLFDQCKDWLASKGVISMQGPVNMLDPTAKWGLLISGFEEDSPYGMPYHHAYYRPFFEQYGFNLLHKQYHYEMDLDEELLRPEYKEKASHILSNPAYRIAAVDKKNPEVFAQHLMEVYNDACQDQPDFLPLSSQMAQEVVQRLLPVIDENMVLFASYQDQPVGFFISLPELNQLYKHMNGKLNLLGHMKYLLHKEKEKKVIALMIAVKKAHQGKGIEAALIQSLLDYLQSRLSSDTRYKSIEVVGVRDSDLKALHLVNKFHLKVSQIFHTYAYVLQDQNKVTQICLEQNKLFKKAL